MDDPESLSERGEAGRLTVASNMGASLRYAEMISTWLEKRAEVD
jgi:hypothetical protein